jgi:hypothetical protein
MKWQFLQSCLSTGILMQLSFHPINYSCTIFIEPLLTKQLLHQAATSSTGSLNKKTFHQLDLSLNGFVLTNEAPSLTR